MSAVATGQRMALLHSGAQLGVSMMAPDLAKVTAAHDQLEKQYRTTHRLAYSRRAGASGIS